MRGGAGKFITIYPTSDEGFPALMEALHQATRDLPAAGPYILSDRRYRDSRILHYRYGGIERHARLRPDGTREPVIRAANGGWIADVRRPYFSLPAGVEDPFGGAREVAGDGRSILAARFQVEMPLSFSNGGGVYLGRDLTNDRRVVIKEARPHTNVTHVDGLRIDGAYLLSHERLVLERTADLTCTPAFIAFFTQWEHTFLVEEYLPYSPFGDFWAGRDHIVGPYVHDSARVASFLPKFSRIATNLIEALEALHEGGIVVGDISPRNVLIDPATERTALIDFEGATLGNDDPRFTVFTKRWGTPGFTKPGRATTPGARPDEDWYALGALLASAVVPVHPLTRLKPSAVTDFLDHFVTIGLPGCVRSTVEHLMAGDPADAKKAVSQVT